jgi:GT2 family glycosyltransferase
MANDPGPALQAKHVCSCPDSAFEVVRPWVHFSYILKAMVSLLRDPGDIRPEKTSHKKLLYRSLRDHRDRSKKWPGSVRIRSEDSYLPEVPTYERDKLPAVDVVIVTHDSERHVRACVQSIFASDYPSCSTRAIVFDNGSKDRTLDILRDFERASDQLRVVRHGHNVGFGAGMDRVLEMTTAGYVLVLSPAAALQPECLRRLVSAALSTEEHGYAIWEARQHPLECPKTYDPVTLETEWICGACFLAKGEVFRKLKGFDEDMSPPCVDVDLSRRTRVAGRKLMYVPSAVVVRRADEHLARGKRPPFRDTIPSSGRLSQLGLRSKGPGSAIKREGECYAMKGSRAKPLVSIIVRTKDRPYYLREALQSVRHQTYPSIEVIVVEDRASSAEGVVAEFADVDCTYLELGEPGGRCRAGNLGLERATGKYVNFLDEDDLFYADHVEGMVGELESAESRLAAYSTAFVVKTDVVSTRPFVYRETEYAKFGREFSREALLSRNYIPIHCMMFSRELYLQEGGLDESMDVLEDWDLWLRYSRRTDFVFVEKTTCLFRVPHDPRLAADRSGQLRAAEDRVRNRHAPGEGTGPGARGP